MRALVAALATFAFTSALAAAAARAQDPSAPDFERELVGAPIGTHGFHVHEVGRCEPPFESAARISRRTGTRTAFSRRAGLTPAIW